MFYAVFFKYTYNRFFGIKYTAIALASMIGGAVGRDCNMVSLQVCTVDAQCRKFNNFAVSRNAQFQSKMLKFTRTQSWVG